MSDQRTTPDATRLLHDLQHSDALQRQPVAGVALEPSLALLRTWQTQRLAQTYADLLADPSSRPALCFFLSDLYAPRDFSQRDHDIEQIYAFLSQVFPAQTLQVLATIIALNRLTARLDNDLCRALVDQLGVTDAIAVVQYAEGYRICTNYEARVQQLDLITEVLTRVGTGSRLPIVGLAMRLAWFPARQTGWGELYDVLKRGYAAFKQLDAVPAFVAIIAQRERRILDQIYAGCPEPFTLGSMPPPEPAPQ